MSSQELRLLALDGGGVRSLSSLVILERLMESIDPDSPPKPCDYFDMIGGTSTTGKQLRCRQTMGCVLADQTYRDHARQTEDEH